MSEVITNKYLDFGGLKKYDELIKVFIANGDKELADAISALNDKIGSLEVGGSDDKTIAEAIAEIYASIGEIVEKQGALEDKDAELDGKDAELLAQINGIIGELEEGTTAMTLVEIANKFKTVEEGIEKNADDIAGVSSRVSTIEGTIEDLKNLGGENGLVAVVDKVNKNVEDIKTLQGAVETLNGEGEGSVKKTAEDAAATALEDAKEYADSLVMDGENPRFDEAGAAAQAFVDAKAYADGLVTDTEGKSKFDAAGAAAQALADAKADAADLYQVKGDYETAGAAATALEDAKEYADALVENEDGSIKFDVAGAAAQALVEAKADAADLYQVKGDYESAGAAAQALVDAKAYVDAIAHASDVKYEEGFIKLYDAEGKVIGNGFDASPFVVDGMLDTVDFVKDENDNPTTTLRFTFNVEDSENKKKTIDVDFGKYVDIYQADGTSLELTDKTFSIKEVAATKTKTVEAIPVAGGPLESLLKDAGINEIAAGTSIEDVLFSLICKELWASELTFSEGTVASSIAQPTFTLTKDGNNVSGTVEIGTKVVLSDITMGAATPSISKNRTYSGFTYGYSAENDNTQDFANTSITAGVDKAAALNEGNYTMSRDYTGFNGAKDDSATANADASEVSLSGAELVVGDGTNKVKVTVGGPNASATFAAMPVYYACSNLKKTKDAVKDSEGQYKSEEKSANTVTSNNASNSKELTVTGKRYMFWGAHAEHKTLNSAIIREHANGGTISTQAKTVTITIPESGVNQFYVALPSGRTLTKVYNTAAGEQFGEVTDSFTSSTIAVEGAEGYTSANYTVWTFNSGTAWVGPNTLTVIIG